MTAVFIISSEGKILEANSTARAWWKIADGAGLIGAFFPDLFHLEVIAETEDDRIFQWELLRDAGDGTTMPLMVQPDGEEAEAYPVEVLLEKASGDTGAAFIACVSKAPAPPPLQSSDMETPPLAPTGPERGEAGPGDESDASPAAARSDSETAWRALEEADHLGFFSLELPEGPCRFSAPWKRMLGYEPSELPDQHETLIKLAHPEDSEATPDHPPHGPPKSRKPFSVEFRMRHKAGHYIWVQSVGIHTFGTSGELEQAIGFHLDIQERKELEEESLQNEERFLTLVERGKLAFFDLDLRNRSAYFSPAWQKMLGYGDGDLANMPETFRRLLDTEHAPEDLTSIFTGPYGESSFARELRMQTKDGNFINLHTHIIRLSNWRGDLVRVVGFQTSVHDRPAPSWDGEAQPEALEAALDTVNEAVILTDPHGGVTFFNEKAKFLSGQSGTNVTGSELTSVLPLIQASDGQPAGNLADQVLASGVPILFSRDFVLEPDNEDPREIILSCHPLRDTKERILGAALIFRDPVEMSLSPEELAKSNRMEALGLLAGGVAHDFNNLLTSILGGISLARETKDWERLGNSEKAALSAKNLTRQLLTFARGRESERKPQNISPLVRDCLRLSSAGSNVSTRIDLPDDLHPVAVDVSRMGQVFQNLIINAIQGMGETGGSLEITGENLALATEEVAGLGAGDHVRILVKDTGKGIPEENLARIFEPFFTTKKTGTGLGLSTVAAIVRNHEGQITVRSKVGVGTTFSVYLPKAAHQAEAERRRAPKFKFGTGRILFMDDDEEIAALAAGMLQRLEYEFDIVSNGEEAIALYRRYLKVDRPYDAVILDLTIVGGMGGEETLRELRALDPDVRAIVSSGYSTDDSTEFYLNKGFWGVLSKPYRSEEMGKVLRHALGLDDSSA